MPGNSIGQALRLTSWGESHGSAIGGVLDGLPSRMPLSVESIQEALDRRKPGGALMSARQEEDRIEILSGVFKGLTTGAPLSFLIPNKDARSQDYEAVKNTYRPGHADYTYHKKYGHYDYRGGGRASARETAVRVAAGSIALQVLEFMLKKEISIKAAVVQLGVMKVSSCDFDFAQSNSLFCPDPASLSGWTQYLSEIKEQGRSVGAAILVEAHGLPAGLGEPVYDKLDADLAKALMSINAVKAVEIGDGFECVDADVGYDEMTETGFLSNRAGGILGGISSGQPIVCRIALKATSSTAQARQTVTHENVPVSIAIKGRHDPCVGIRAVPIAQAMVALTLADHLLRWRGSVWEG